MHVLVPVTRDEARRMAANVAKTAEVYSKRSYTLV